MSDEKSQENGTKTEEVEEGKLPIELRAEHAEEDLGRLFDEYPQYLKEYNEVGVEEFTKKYGETVEEEIEEKDGLEGSEENGDDDFLEEEKSDEPKKEADAPLKGEIDGLTSTLKSVVEELKELKQGQSKEEKKKIDSDIKEIDLSGLDGFDVDDVDLYTEEGQAQTKKHIKALTGAMVEATKAVNSTKDRIAELDNIKSEVGEIREEAKESKRRESLGDHIVEEFKAIDEMVKDNKLIFGEKVRPIKAIEDDYLESVGEMLKKVAKTDAKVFGSNGSFSPEALKVLELYSGSTEKAKRFQDQCKSLEVALPEDMDALQAVYDIRRIKSKLSLKDKDGQIIKPAEYGTAAENYLGANIERYRAKERVGARDAHERAILKRRSFAPETDTSLQPESEDIGQMSNTAVEELLLKGSTERTKEENLVVAKMLNYKGFDHEEIVELTGLARKEYSNG